MKRLIAVEIEPHEDVGRCGECHGPWRAECECCDSPECGNRLWSAREKLWFRGEQCLAAEARIEQIKREALVEALREVHAVMSRRIGWSKEDAMRHITRMIAKEEGK